MTAPGRPGLLASLRLNFLAKALQHQAWAITDEGLASIEATLQHGLNAEEAAPLDVAETRPQMQPTTSGRQVAIVTLHGVIVDRAPSWAASWGYINPRDFANTIRQLADNPQIASICIWADSPGGTVSGTVEAGEAVAYARSKKPIVLVASDMACSGAYWLASQCSQVVVSPTALVGSIGVITSHTDFSGYYQQLGVVVTFIRSATKKALGQATEPLTEEARAERQGMVDKIHAQFVQAVAKGRRTARDKVASNWATGQLWVGQEAVTAGVADRVASLGTILNELTGNATAPTPPDPPLDDDDTDAQAAAADPVTLRPAAEDPAPAVQDGPPADHNEQPPEGGAHVQEDTPMNIAAITAKLKKGESLTAEESAFLTDHLDKNSAAAAPAGASAAAASQVDLSVLNPEVRQLIENAEKKATDAQATADTERNARLTREFGDRAVALGHPRAFGVTLRAAAEALGDSDAGKAQFKALEDSLRATNAQHALLTERGNGQESRASGNVFTELSDRTVAVLKDHPGLTKAEAHKKIFAEDPEFARRYAGR